MIDGRHALEWIYHRHKRGLFVLALSITRSRADAEDAVHNAFVRLCRGWVALPAEPTAYVFAAVRNAAIDRVRCASAKAVPLAALLACEDDRDHAASRERDLAIAGAIDTLAEELRSVVLMRAFGELTFRQIGELVDAPTQTVVSRYAAALEQLRPQLRNYL